MKMDKTELIDVIFIIGTIAQAIFTAMVMLARWNLDVFCGVTLVMMFVVMAVVVNSETDEDEYED